MRQHTLPFETEAGDQRVFCMQVVRVGEEDSPVSMESSLDAIATRFLGSVRTTWADVDHDGNDLAANFVRSRNQAFMTILNTSESKSGGYAKPWLQWYMRSHGETVSIHIPAFPVHFSSTVSRAYLTLYTLHT
jgi:hypothetical protein